MDIGKEERTIIVTPVESPVPQREERPARRSIPSRTPDPAPVREPVKTPEKV
jgi:hypothetical protein